MQARHPLGVTKPRDSSCINMSDEHRKRINILGNCYML